MTARDRFILMVLGAAGILAAFWFLALSPKREDARTLNTQIATAQQRLETARAGAAAAQDAKARYDRDYATVANLGKAVPTDDGVSSLVYQLQSTARGASVDFLALKLDSSGSGTPATGTPAAQVAALGNAQGTASSSSSGSSSTTPSTSTTAAAATQTAAATLPPGATVGAAGFPTLPFSFTFTGGFFQMQRFLADVDRLVRLSGSRVAVDGRLLTIDGFALSAAASGFPKVKASISATAYILPASEGATGGATPAGPPATTASASSSASGAVPTTTATVTGVK